MRIGNRLTPTGPGPVGTGVPNAPSREAEDSAMMLFTAGHLQHIKAKGLS
jgi:hypothetical protein